MHLSREMTRFEVVDLSSRRGDRKRSSAPTPDTQARRFPDPPSAQTGATRGPLAPAKTVAPGIGSSDWQHSA